MKLESLSVSLQPSLSPEPVAVAVAIMAVHTLVWACMAALTWSISSIVSSRAPFRASTLLSSCLDILFLLFLFCYIRSTALDSDLRTKCVFVRAAFRQVRERQLARRAGRAHALDFLFR